MLIDLETKSATFCKNFLSLIDCLITPKHEVPELGDFDIGTFLLLVLVSLESMEVELELILVVVTPLRTKDVEAKEEQLELFCTETDISELLVEMHMHVDSSNSLLMQLSLRLDCAELEIHTMSVCD